MLARNVIAVMCFVGCSCQQGIPSRPQKVTIDQSDDKAIEELIEKLIQIDTCGLGYCETSSGTGFLPYSDSQTTTSVMLGRPTPQRSEALCAIITKGIEAVPSLLKHIGDSRPAKMESISGMMSTEYPDEYDFNRRTRLIEPRDVNREWRPGEKHPIKHSITVGDLCFVALGQITNRSFSAARYRPSGGLMINSPTYSGKLKKVILEDWSQLSRRQHKRLLIDDFLRPDKESRRIGAYWRLSLYYPEAIEQLVLEALQQPVLRFEESVISSFCKDTLYRTQDEHSCRVAYDSFVNKTGVGSSSAIMRYLFEQLRSNIEHERIKAHQLLIHIGVYNYSVKPHDQPKVNVWYKSERAHFICALTHDSSLQIGNAVTRALLEDSNNPFFAHCCLKCLASRGYETVLLERLSTINGAVETPNLADQNAIEAIAVSQSPLVRKKLFDILHNSGNDAYFMAAVRAIDETEGSVFLNLAQSYLDRLQEDTDSGKDVLRLVMKRSPEKAQFVFESFLSSRNARRSITACELLSHGHPLSLRVLAPLLSDQSKLTVKSVPTRVCDRAAMAISRFVKTTGFNIDSSEELRNEQIEQLKVYCESGWAQHR